MYQQHLQVPPDWKQLVLTDHSQGIVDILSMEIEHMWICICCLQSLYYPSSHSADKKRSGKKKDLEGQAQLKANIYSKTRIIK